MRKRDDGTSGKIGFGARLANDVVLPTPATQPEPDGIFEERRHAVSMVEGQRSILR
jgi:hypothetical protein